MSPPDAAQTGDLAERLAVATATIEALLSGQIDAVFDPRTSTPVLLAKAQEALRESEERYRSIVETANEGIWIADRHSRITFVNRRLAEMLDYPVEEMLGRSLFQFVPEAAEATALERVRRAQRGASEEDEVPLVRKDRSELWVLLRTTPLRASDGKVVGTLAMMTDWTRHRQGEDALRASEEQYRQIVESTTDGIIKIDTQGRILFVNRRFAEMLGHEPGAMIGMSAPALTRADATSFIEPEEALAARDTVDTTLLHKGGADIWANIAITRLLDENGQQAGELWVVRDVTERKKLMSQLMVSDRMASLGTLAAGVAHEINNPLAAVIANLDLMWESVGLSPKGDPAPSGSEGSPSLREELRALLDDAREAAARVRFIVRDLQIFSRTPSVEPRDVVNVETIMESSLRMAWNEIRHHAHLVKRYGAVPGVKANEARLGQVFLNLLVNATQAFHEGGPEPSPEPREICVSTRLEGQRVVIEVSDNGAGIPPEIVGRIFDAFFTTKAVGVGTGLGLAICQRIVTDMEGELTVESTVGKGTTFRVSLPVAGEVVGRPSTPVQRAPAGGRRGRLLVIDDEILALRTVQRILARDHEVVAVLDAKEALARCSRGETFDLVLCDLMMPQMTGMDFHRELSLVAPGLASAMIFLTGGAFTERTRQFLSDIPNDRIEKPFDVGELRALVERHLNRRWHDDCKRSGDPV